LTTTNYDIRIFTRVVVIYTSKLVVNDVVRENIDKLACSLAEAGNPTEAWRSIFIKPPHKSWSDTVVAIKTNNIAQQHTRSAVMSKMCHTLTHTLGVNPFNIHIYDACHGRNMHKKTAFEGLPKGCRVENKWGGSSTLTSIPKPWKNGTEKILFPRQQLCLIDALWASKGGPGGNPTHQPSFLAMGVLSPIVDYQVATKFRSEKMGWQPNMRMTHRMLTDFGYYERDLPYKGKIIEL